MSMICVIGHFLWVKICLIQCRRNRDLYIQEILEKAKSIAQPAEYFPLKMIDAHLFYDAIYSKFSANSVHWFSNNTCHIHLFVANYIITLKISLKVHIHQKTGKNIFLKNCALKNKE